MTETFPIQSKADYESAIATIDICPDQQLIISFQHRPDDCTLLQ